MNDSPVCGVTSGVGATLVDFGGGRRLERLGGILVDRPLPQATLPPALPAVWREALVKYTGGAGGESAQTPSHAPDRLPRGWERRGNLPEPWEVEVPLHSRALRLSVRPAASGQTGLFLEQAPQWAWLERVAAPERRVLSLFAHSGAASLALAIAGVFWLVPLWVVAAVPAADRLAGSRMGRAGALLLLGLSVVSVAHPTWSPWTTPWIERWLTHAGWLTP